MKRTLITLALVLVAAGGASAQQYVAGGFPATEVDLAQVPATISGNPVRRVIADQLPLYTRPVPEAAVLDRLDVGARVPLQTEGGGWATMDLGGGFLGWMRIEGLGPDIAAPKAATGTTRVIPVPASRPAHLGSPVAAEADIPLEAVTEPRIRRF